MDKSSTIEAPHAKAAKPAKESHLQTTVKRALQLGA